MASTLASALSRTRADLSDAVRLLGGHHPRLRSPALQDVLTRRLRSRSGGTDWVVELLNTTIRIRSVSSRWLYLGPRRAISRAVWQRRGTVAEPRPGPTRTLSILCPTRSRVRAAAAFLANVDRTAARADRVEVLLYVDDDDEALAEYRGLAARVPRPGRSAARRRIHVGPSRPLPQAFNVLAREATGELLLMGNDDQCYVDYGWDAAADAVADAAEARWPDGIFVAYFDGGQYPEGAPDFPIVSRAWYDALGYFTSELFRNWETEQWIFDIARRVGRLSPVPGIFVDHRHFQSYKATFDRTYQRHRMTRAKSVHDHVRFLRTGPDRAAEAERLMAAIATADRRGSRTGA